MKKRVEAELISIAHRILKLKNKSDVDQLYKETQKLYETLSVLKFYQDNYEVLKSEVDAAELEEKLETAFDAETPQAIVAEVKAELVVETEAPAVEVETLAAEDAQEEPVVTEAETEVETVVEEEAEEEVAEMAPEVAAEPAATEAPLFTPIFELAQEEAEEEAPAAETASELKPDTKHIALEDLLGENYVDPIFVKPNEVSLFPTETKEEKASEPEIAQPKPAASLNSAFAKTIEIGLNDRIAFVNHLFGESNEDFNRVISQLNTFDTLEEAKTFLNEMVIPDYNYWVGKEDYIERFMTVLENKFK
ncbi:hypothetical protein [Flavobacterium sp.]|uniref:hypothetical protein n=1 Tax=Flavobacterium sp. TaxID=239 RepID=UPI0025E91391|nr:hypothetical protein [Flavobacterium sp.]